jgi:uncharacterized beta-barrel protein YwiB (DUF1934 family)
LKNNYFISIYGKQDFDPDNSLVSVETTGNYVKKGNFEYIIYKEYDEEDPKKYSTSILKIDGGKCVTYIKNGESRTKLVLENGKRHHCCYNTEFGCLMVGVFTDNITSNFSDKGGELKVNYHLDVNSSLTSVNEITVKIRRID